MPAWLMVVCSLASYGVISKPDSHELARRIDRHIAARLSVEHVSPAECADDAEFLRRLSLDLIGQIPTPAEVQAFLQQAHPAKRGQLLERLLGDPRHARHFARVWRALLLPEVQTDPRIAYFQPGFEAWLQQRRQENAGFDAIVRELLTVPIPQPDQSPQFVLRDLRRPNPVAFIASKQAEPAKIATSCVRLFLGVRLECAQCHDHPFDRWTQKQFWSQAAFFAGIERRGRGPFAPLVEAVDRNSIRLGDTDRIVAAALLDGSKAQRDERKSPRIRFADWVTSRRNVYFARTIVNRVWGQLMGMGLVNPVDDFRDSNPATHPELLQELADDFAASGFNLSHLYRAVCLTDAYQRTSRRTGDGQARAELFACMSLKPLSGDQFFDSLTQAIGQSESSEQGQVETDQETLRRRVLGAFSTAEEAGPPKTSVTQALALMNGSVVHHAVTPETSPRLRQALEEFPGSAERQIESLYLATLSRYPNQPEKRMMLEYCGSATAAEHQRRLGDVFWVLLNSAEFRWNH